MLRKPAFMEIHFYLNEKEVPKVFFKQFSSRCHAWLTIIDKYQSLLESGNRYLKLNYIPANNDVVPVYDENDPLLKQLHKEVVTGK